MKKIMSSFLAGVLLVNTSIGSFAMEPIGLDIPKEQTDTTSEVAPQSAMVEFFIGWVAGKALDFLLDLVMYTPYA